MSFFDKNNRTFVRMAALLAAVCLACAVFCGCSEIKAASPLGDDVLVEISGSTISTAEGIFRLLEQKELYEADGAYDIWKINVGSESMSDYIKDSVKDELCKFAAAELMADELLVYMTDEERSAAEKEAKAAYSRLSSDYNLAQYGITESTVSDLYISKALYDAVYYKISENLLQEISEADTKVIEVNYVYIPTTVTYTDAMQIREEIKESGDIMGVCDSYGYIPSMHQVISKGSMPTAFENVAYALVDGEFSEVVETKDGYYIIECVEDYMVTESIANENEIFSKERQARFNAAYLEFATQHSMRFNSDFWDGLDVETLE